MEEGFLKRLEQKEAEFVERLREEMSKFDKLKEEEVAETKDRMRKQSKSEMESLRSRFKVMHSAGAAMTRSPSISESELSIEVITSFLLCIFL